MKREEEIVQQAVKEFPRFAERRVGFISGAKWADEHPRQLWKDAQCDDLPEIEREVVVFTQDFQNDAGIMKVAIAHRPDPAGFWGKSVIDGEYEHYQPKTYDKGGWNIHDVKYWLDLNLPMEE